MEIITSLNTMTILLSGLCNTYSSTDPNNFPIAKFVNPTPSPCMHVTNPVAVP